MSNKYFFLLFAAIILTVNGCYYDNEEELYPATFCDTVNVTYGGTVKAIVETKCAIPTCHTAGGDGSGDYHDFAKVAEKVADGRFLSSILKVDGAIGMPPDGYVQLRECEIRQIKLWIASGGENN